MLLGGGGGMKGVLMRKKRGEEMSRFVMVSHVYEKNSSIAKGNRPKQRRNRAQKSCYFSQGFS